MRRGRVFFLLAFIIILSLVLFYALYQRSLGPANQPETVAPEATPEIFTVDVIFVTQRVPRGMPLSGDVLSSIPIPQELYYDGLFTSLEEPVGKLARFDLEAGIPLSRQMLADSAEELSGTGSNAALTIPPGMVAVSIPINRLSSVSYAPRDGDHVNVIVSMSFVDIDPDFQTLLPNRTSGILTPGSGTGTLSGTAGQSQGLETRVEGSSTAGIQFDTSSVVAVSSGGGNVVGKAVTDPVLEQTFYQVPSEPTQRPRIVSQNLLQDVVVLHVGEFTLAEEEAKQAEAEAAQAAGEEQPPTEQQPTDAENAPGTPPPDVITIIVNPQDAITLNYLLFSGAKLTLALRPAGDPSRVETESVTASYLLEQYNITVPSKLANGFESLPDIIQPRPTPQP